MVPCARYYMTVPRARCCMYPPPLFARGSQPSPQAELPVFKKGEEEEKDPFSRERRELVKARDTLKVIVGALTSPS
jgi:hypothetical protein